MKTIWAFLALILTVSVSLAQNDDKAPKLLGIADGFGMKFAIIQAQLTGRSEPVQYYLGEGQELGELGIVKIDPAKGVVNLKAVGKDTSLAFDGPTETQPTDTSEPPVIRFRSVNLIAAIRMYADFKGKTVLQHPRVPKTTFSLTSRARTKEEAAEAFEVMFREQKIATIPDGEHFVMVVPFALTNLVTPKAPAFAITNSLVPAVIPARSINIFGSTIAPIVQIYADFLGKKITDFPAVMNQKEFPCCATVSFLQSCPL
ncbi:MAG TPA: hypothetical protein VHC44_09985 [Verrucomicrobiae bacterium]|nr:hypothetical protein [Verrucomicrobiae bacterium]